MVEAAEKPPPPLRHRMHHDRGFGDAEPRAAQLDRHGDAEPARFRHRLVEFVREAGRLVAFRPVIVAEAGADLRDIVGDGAMLGGERDIQGASMRLSTILREARPATGQGQFRSNFRMLAVKCRAGEPKATRKNRQLRNKFSGLISI